MPRRPRAPLATASVPLALCLGLLAAADAADPSPLGPHARLSDDELFTRQVWPLLQRACVTCHGEDDPENGLRVDSRTALLLGGDSGPAVQPGKPEDSLLIRVVRWQHGDMRMPPRKQLPGSDIALLEEWVRRGLPWTMPAAPAEAERAAGYTGPRWRAPWWQGPPALPPLPARRSPRERTEMDRFAFAPLEALGLEPVAEVDRARWLRRASYTLTATLPAVEEVDAFVKEAGDEQAVRARAVERLLASPAYARAWARRWLDWSLPAGAQPGADDGARARLVAWLEAALARDLPVDALVAAHFGEASEALPAELAREHGKLAARHAGAHQGARDAQLAALGRAFLGLELDCARCHDHPRDPVAVTDYQALARRLAADGTGTSGSAAGASAEPGPLGSVPVLARHPLLARVLASRVFAEHLGRPLVPGHDFGATGAPPSHPALLEHLAARLASTGSLKALHREIVLSATFALGSVPGARQRERDPEGRLLSHVPPRRVSPSPPAVPTASARAPARERAAALFGRYLGRAPSAAELDAAEAIVARGRAGLDELAATLTASLEWSVLR